MLILKFVANVKILVINMRKKMHFLMFLRVCIKGVEVFIENNFHLVCNWSDVRQCGIDEMLFLYLILPAFEDTMLFYNFCIFSTDMFSMLVTIRKYMFLYIHHQGFEDCSGNQHFVIQFGIERSESNCHRKEIDVSLICSGANLKWNEPNVTKRKTNCLA